MALITRAGLPFISNTSSQIELLYLRHSLAAENSVLNVQGDTNNFFASFYLSYDWQITTKFGLHPKAGFGYTFQSTTVTGEDVNESFNNSFPHVGAGIDLSYRLTNRVDGILNLQSLIELEGDVTTFAQNMSLGVNYWL